MRWRPFALVTSVSMFGVLTNMVLAKVYWTASMREAIVTAAAQILLRLRYTRIVFASILKSTLMGLQNMC